MCLACLTCVCVCVCLSVCMSVSLSLSLSLCRSLSLSCIVHVCVSGCECVRVYVSSVSPCACIVLCTQQHLEQQWSGAAVCLWFCTAGHQRTGALLLRSQWAPANSTQLTASEPGSPPLTTAGGGGGIRGWNTVQVPDTSGTRPRPRAVSRTSGSGH